MNGHITAAVAAARRADLQRAAGCCTALIEHRRADGLLRVTARSGSGLPAAGKAAGG
jgi:hypothetical protein